jgi:hypothetical protein
MAPFLDPTFRGSGGNVGIIRSPVRATALPGNSQPPQYVRKAQIIFGLDPNLFEAHLQKQLAKAGIRVQSRAHGKMP